MTVPDDTLSFVAGSLSAAVCTHYPVSPSQT
jgi:hypothetical protein